MTYRQIAQIAKCSSGAVSAEIRKMKEEAKVRHELKCSEIKATEELIEEPKIELEMIR